MQKIHILIPLHTLPSIQSYKTIMFDNLLPALRNKSNVYVTWIVYQADKLNSFLPNKYDESILDIHSYANAVKLLENIKPDIIYADATWDLIDYAFSSAGKFLNIPVIGGFISDSKIIRKQKTLVKLIIARFFENSIPTDTDKNKKQFMRRGRFFIYKYIFLFKTLNATNLNTLKSIKKCLIILKLFLSITSEHFDSRFANTLHWLESESLVESLVKSGFDKSSLVVTGNPMLDESYEKIKQFKSPEKSDKIRVLLLPSTHYEHGFWTKKQRDFVIGGIIRKILENKNHLELIIKIHPSTANISDYESLISKMDQLIPVYQTGQVLDYLNNADVVISFWYGSAEVYSILAKKPLIFCNFFNDSPDDILQRELVLECKEISSLVRTIDEVFLSNPASEQKRDKFIRESLGKWDGKASERISNAIITLLKKTSNHK